MYWNNQKNIEKTHLQRKQALDQCLLYAQEAYNLNWDSGCRALNLNNNCILPFSVGDREDLRFKNDKEDCYRKAGV